MNKNFTWKIVLIIAVLVIFSIPLVPTAKRPEPINLGLDLKGGTHLVMQVNTDDAISAEIDQSMVSFRNRAEGQQLPAFQTRRTPEGFVATVPEGVSTDAYEKIAREWLPSFSTSARGNTIEFRLQPQIASQLRDDTVDQAMETIRNRIDSLGVTEPTIARQGGAQGERLVLQLPGVDDPERVKEIIRTTAQLQFRIVEGNPGPDRDSVRSSLPPEVADQVDILAAPRSDQFGRTVGTQFMAVRKEVPVTGRDLKTARVTQGQLGEPVISFSLTTDGSRKFGDLTGANVDRQLAIVLDDRIQSAPVIRSRIEDQGVIEGSFTQDEARDLALVLRSGALPASLTTLEERTVGPSLGRDSIIDGVTASVAGFILVMIGVVLYYRGAGVNAVVALLLNLVLVLGLMSYFGATLTLPGIAGLILTLAMAIDSNVLVFERIREELRNGKSIRASIEQGFQLAFGTIIDTHLTTVIAALFLFQFGSGPVKGFAVTLLIGLAASIFTAFFVSRVMFDLLYNRGERPKSISI